MTIANKFEIHYFLNNGSHSMDAVVKNKCEAEFLAVGYEIIALLDLDITLNAEALCAPFPNCWNTQRVHFGF